MSIFVINVGTPLLSELTNAFAKDNWSLERPCQNCSSYIRTKVVNDQTKKIQDIYLSKKGVEFLGISRDEVNYEDKQTLLGHRIHQVSFFVKLQFPQDIVCNSLKFSPLEDPVDKIKTFLKDWGFQEKIITAVEKAGHLNSLALMLLFDMFPFEKLPSDMSSTSLPSPSASLDDITNKNYKLLLKKAKLRRAGEIESQILGQPNSKVKPLFKALYELFKDEKKKEISTLRQLSPISPKMIQNLYLLGLFDIFHDNMMQHEHENSEKFSLYTIDIDDILRIFPKVDNKIEWMLFQVAYFRLASDIFVGLRALSNQFQTWLETSTYFPEIIANLSDLKRNRKTELLREVFLIAGNELFKSKGYALPVRLDEDSPSYIAYKTQDGKTSLCKWSGRWSNLSSKVFLGDGTYGIVQKVKCLGTGKLMALKAPSMGGQDLLYNEINCLKLFADSKHINRVFAVVKDGDMVAYMREYREMALLDAFMDIDRFDVTLGGICKGLLDILNVFELMAQKKQAHFDIKGDNVLCDYNAEIKGFDCYVDDFGLSRPYSKVNPLKSQIHQPSVTENDINLLSKLKPEAKSLLVEKIEVRELGVMFYSLLTRKQWSPGIIIPWESFENIFGEKITSIIKNMIEEDVKNRFDFGNAIQGLTDFLNSETPEDRERQIQRFTSKSQDMAWRKC